MDNYFTGAKPLITKTKMEKNNNNNHIHDPFNVKVKSLNLFFEILEQNIIISKTVERKNNRK